MIHRRSMTSHSALDPAFYTDGFC